MQLPAVLAQMVDGERLFTVSGATIGQALEALVLERPGLRVHLFDETGGLRPHVLCFHNEEYARGIDGLATPIEEGDRLTILNSIAGGSAQGSPSYDRVDATPRALDLRSRQSRRTGPSNPTRLAAARTTAGISHPMRGVPGDAHAHGANHRGTAPAGSSGDANPATRLAATPTEHSGGRERTKKSGTSPVSVGCGNANRGGRLGERASSTGIDPPNAGCGARSAPQRIRVGGRAQTKPRRQRRRRAACSPGARPVDTAPRPNDER